MTTITTLGTIQIKHDENCVCEGTGKVLKQDGYEMVDTYPCEAGKIVHKGAYYNSKYFNHHTNTMNFPKGYKGKKN